MHIKELLHSACCKLESIVYSRFRILMIVSGTLLSGFLWQCDPLNQQEEEVLVRDLVGTKNHLTTTKDISSNPLNQDMFISEKEKKALCAYVDSYFRLPPAIKDRLMEKVNTLTQQYFDAMLGKDKQKTERIQYDKVIRKLLIEISEEPETLEIVKQYAFEKKKQGKLALRDYLDTSKHCAAIKEVVGKKIDALTTYQSFNELLDKILALKYIKRSDFMTGFVIDSDRVDFLYHVIVDTLVDIEKKQIARNQAFPSDEEGRRALLEYLHKYFPSIAFKEGIEEKISNYTKEYFNQLLDNNNFLTDKYPAELSALDNIAYISALDAHIITTNDFSKLYGYVILDLYLESKEEVIKEPILLRNSSGYQSSVEYPEDIQLLQRAVALAQHQDEILSLFSSSGGSFSFGGHFNPPLPTKE